MDYRVNEDEGTVTVCVLTDFPSPDDISVTITTGETSQPSAKSEFKSLAIVTNPLWGMRDL